MKSLFFACCVLLTATFYHRVNHYDEAWLAEQAYWLVRDGRVRSELFRGLNGWENGLFIFHKGFIYLSAGWQWLFGFSLLAGKMFSLLWSLLTGWLLARYLQQQRVSPLYLWLGLTLYAGSGLVAEFSFVYRPEAMCTALGFASFLALTNQRPGWAGLLAGLAALTHLNGLCFVLAGFGWLLWQRQNREALRFCLFSTLVSSLYVADIALSNAWLVAWYQFMHDPAMAHLHTLADKLRATLSVVKFASLVAELVLLGGGTYLLNRFSPAEKIAPAQMEIGRYLWLLLSAFVLLNRSNSSHYALLFVPFISSYVALSAASWSPEKPSGRLFQALIGLYLLAGIYRAGQLLAVNRTSPGVTLLNARMASHIGQPGSRVLAPLDFFYEQMDHYRLQAIDMYRFRAQLEPRYALSPAALFALADRQGFVAIITYDGKGLGAPLTDTRPQTDSLNRIGCYQRVYQDRWNSLYLRR